MSRQNISRRIFSSTRPELWICLFLALMTLAVYVQVRNFEFITFDDPMYLTENPRVAKGLSLANIVWAFGTLHAANWHPITWLSHMLDVELYGLNPGAHHLTNLQLHIANTLLLFFVFKLMTGGLWRSALVAALFALHPLHVESVAWIAERKDVLSTFFWFLTLLLYHWYVRRPKLSKYLAVLVSYGLGLMAKPMLVTLPITLLLLDYWPLGRWQSGPLPEIESGSPRKPFLFLVYEKIPLFLLSMAASSITLLAQIEWRALSSLEAIPMGVRIANAAVAYAAYIGKMFSPSRLAVIYPYSKHLPLWQIIGAGFIIGAISLVVFRLRRKQPGLILGWAWYLATLIPVIGLVQVGLQSMADRYTYVPMIGLFIMMVWGVPAGVFCRRPVKTALATGICAVLVVLSVASWRQVRYWENSVVLFQHARQVTEENYFACNNLGGALEFQGRLKEGIRYYQEALEINPNFAHGHYNLGRALEKQGKSEEARKHYLLTLQLDPKQASAHNSLGNLLLGMGKLEEAAVQYREALRVEPDNAQAYNNLGIVLAKQEKPDEAIRHYYRALEINPEFPDACYNLAKTLASLGRLDESIYYSTKALTIDPGHVEAIVNLGNVLAKLGRINASIGQYKRALQVQPDNFLAMKNLNAMQALIANLNREISKLQDSIALCPDNADAHFRLAQLYRQKGEARNAEVHYRKALSADPGFSEASCNLAILYAKKGNYESARSILKASIGAKPDEWKAYYYIAGTYARQNRVEDAIAWLEKAVARGFNNWGLLSADGNFEKIRGTQYYRKLVFQP